MIYQSVYEFIGNTPLMEVCNLEREHNTCARVLIKIEAQNPSGSVKDRAAKYMIEDAEKRGLLKPGATIVEPTSGNTGIGLAAIAASKGYRVILTMPETMSVERRNILKVYGAEIVLTEGSKGMSGAIEKAEELVRTIEGAFLPAQFDNPANATAHYETTGPEIWKDTEGKVDIFVAGVGTGGTLTGTAKYLKEQNSKIQVVAVEPIDSPVLSQGKSGAHPLQGIGAGFIPSVLDTTLYDSVVTVSGEEAYVASKELTMREGILTGISSGAALHAALKLAVLPENKDKTIVVLLPDSGDRYYSTPLFT
ncbi:MAG: cysteine synthase A [Lachnospiraceae bacterium]|nr:cysteine synthase A [Lachnospiraceae bacterium]